jgi:predicted  nucleic acid-binding Zn-ribbon protein
MLKQQINLSIIEENPTPIPEEIQRLGGEAFQLLWQTSQQIAKQEVEIIKTRYQQFEAEAVQQRQVALDKVKQVNSEIEVTKMQVDSLTRENKSLQVDLNRKIGELESAHDQVHHLQERIVQQEHDVKKLTEELGRARENVDNLQKRLYEVTRQSEQDRQALKEVSAESLVNFHTRERLDKNLKTAMQEAEQVWKQLKVEQTRAAVAEALVQETKETIKKLEGDIHLLKDEKHEIKGSVETESRARMELEKKVAALTARSETQEWGYKEMITKLEKELEIAKSDAATLRNRLIKAEGALEREKKAIERLETKLVAAGR